MKLPRLSAFAFVIGALLILGVFGFVNQKLNPPVKPLPLYNPWVTPFDTETVSGQLRTNIPSEGVGVFIGVKSEMVVRPGQKFLVNSVKCMKPEIQNRTTYVGSKFWKSIQPPDQAVTVYENLAAYTDPGCSPVPYEQSIPSGVLVEAQRLADAGQLVSEWQITGTLVADVPDGLKGQFSGGKPVTWYTENFVIDLRPA